MDGLRKTAPSRAIYQLRHDEKHRSKDVFMSCKCI